MPGGLLEAFGIDPIANKRDRQMKEALQMQRIIAELQNKGQLDVERERQAGGLKQTEASNKGQLDVEKLKGENERLKQAADALIKHAQTLGVSPDNMAALQSIRMDLDKTTLGTAKERGEQSLSDAKRGTEMRATDKNMRKAVAESETARAAIPAITARKESALSTPKGGLTTSWTPYGPATQAGAIESNTLVPSTIPGLPPTVSQAESFPSFIDPSIMAQMPQTEAEAAQQNTGTGAMVNPPLTSPLLPSSPAFSITPAPETSTPLLPPAYRPYAKAMQSNLPGVTQDNSAAMQQFKQKKLQDAIRAWQNRQVSNSLVMP